MIIGRRVRATLLSSCSAGAALALCGCSTVSSVDLSTTHERDRAGAYLSYSVAKSMFVIQIAAATPTAQAPTSAAPPTPAPPSAVTPSPPAPAAAAAQPMTATPLATTPAATQPVDTSECAVLSAEYTTGQSQVAAEISAYGLLQGRIAQMAAGKPVAQDTPKQLSADLKVYADFVRDPTYLATLGSNNDTIYDQIVADCFPRVTLSIQQLIVPDITRTFALKARTNVFYTDALTFGTDANGFLTNGAPTSTSEIPAIGTAVASDIGMAFTPTGFAGRAFAANLDVAEIIIAKPQTSCVSAPVSGLDQQLDDLATCSSAAAARNLLGQITVDLSPPGAMRNLPAATLPLTTYLPIEDLLANSGTPTDGVLKYISTTFKVAVAFNCSPRDPATPTTREQPENAPSKDDYGQPRAPGVYNGLVVSASRACEFRATQKSPGIGIEIPLSRSRFWSQDSRYLTLLPTARGFLVARSVSYTFANGQPTGVTDSRPSEALAFFSFLGSIPGAFASGVTTGATNNQAVLTASTSNITALTNNLTAQTNYQTAVKNAKAAATAPATPGVP